MALANKYYVMVNSTLSGGMTGYDNFQFDNQDYSLSATNVSISATTNIVGIFTYNSVQVATINDIALNWDTIQITTDYDVDISDPHIMLVDTSEGDVNINMPNPSTAVNILFRVKKVDIGAGQVIINGYGGETFDGSSSITLLTQWDSTSIVTNGTDWYVF